MNASSWNKLSLSHKVGVFTLGAILITYLLYQWVLAPQWAKIDGLTAQCLAEQQQVAIVETFVTAHPNPEQYLLELDNKLLFVNQLFPDTVEVSSFLTQIEQLSRECGVQLNYLKPGKLDNKTGYREQQVDFSISGTFPQIMLLLQKVENGSRFTNITQSTMTLTKTGLEDKISAKIYIYGVPAAEAKPASPNTPPAPLPASK